MSKPLTVVQVGGFGNIGDNVYRVHEPAAAMARLPGVLVYEVHAQSRWRDAAALAADVLVLTMSLDVEVFRLIHQRRQLGKPTICEVNDYLPDVQPWNPAHLTWADTRGRHLFEQLIIHSDATQVTTDSLASRVTGWAQQVAVFPNHLAHLPPPRQPRVPDSKTQLVVGWGGSLGHRQDVAHIAPALTAWLQRQPLVRLEIMGAPWLLEFFKDVPPEQFSFHQAGPLAGYLQWLAGVDIGLAPLLPTEYNRCRSDVKFLEYACCGVVPVLQRLDPYSGVKHGETGFLFDTPEGMIEQLDQLVASPALRQQVASAAYAHVSSQRRMDSHAHQRIDFYREQVSRAQAAWAQKPPAALPEALVKAGCLSLQSLPGWQALTPSHHRMDLQSPAEQHVSNGVDVLQTGDVEKACQSFATAVRLDATYAHAFSFLGHCLLQLGRPRLAREALERAVALDPLLSRPVRALARLHRSAAEQYSRQAAALNPLQPPPRG
ncbi:MAG: glycosyltransferase [Pseudomonadota bacterium]